MNTINSVIPKLARKYTPEEIEASRKAIAARNAICDPDCPICKGGGYISAGFGKIELCPTLFQRQIRANAARYGLAPSDVEKMDWSIVKDIGGSIKAMKAVQETITRGYGWLFLWGDHGQAKTLLLKIAIAVSLRAGREAAYTNMVGILDNLKLAFDEHGGDPRAESKLDWWQGLPILAVDEFNRVKETAWAGERRFALMDARYTQAIRQETITLIASNTSPDQQEGYLRDRILDGRFEVIELTGPSARKSIKSRSFTF